MSRVTPPVTKLVHAIRGISSSTRTAHPSALLDSHTRNAAYLPRRVAHLKSECIKRQLPTSGIKAELADRLMGNDITRAHSTLGGHRPIVMTQPSTTAPFRFMQGFNTSAPKSAAHDISSIDFMFFPEQEVAAGHFNKLRVPLLPDNYNPDRSVKSGNAVETLDEAVPRPEIIIMASHPESVLPTAMTEIVANEGIEVDLKELTKYFNNKVSEKVVEPGMMKELWNSFLDDVMGGKSSPKAAI